MDLKWYLIIILLCLRSITTNLEHIFICFFFFAHSYVFFCEVSLIEIFVFVLLIALYSHIHTY